MVGEIKNIFIDSRSFKIPEGKQPHWQIIK